eukprot:scaffold24_cov341-Pavlova_lutheri.AAC.12
MHFSFLAITIHPWASLVAAPAGANLPFLLGQSAHALATGRSGWMHLVFFPAIEVDVAAWAMAPLMSRVSHAVRSNECEDAGANLFANGDDRRS